MYFREIIIFRKEALGFLDCFRFKGSTGIPIFEICSKKQQQWEITLFWQHALANFETHQTQERSTGKLSKTVDSGKKH